MTVNNVFAWSELTLNHLFLAYRKAKADCFFERSIVAARDFAEFEENLTENLIALLVELQQGRIASLLNLHSGEVRLAAKKLGLEAKPRNSQKSIAAHGYFSEPLAAFDYLATGHSLIPDFRLVGKFSIVMHTLSALWINLVGHKLDATLSASAYGSRLRRYRPEAGSPPGTVGEYHLNAIGSFVPYFSPYKAWRQRGMQAIRDALTKDESVIAISLDLTSYYHSIDASFLTRDRFYKEIGLQLTDWERDFTARFVDALFAWCAKGEEWSRHVGVKELPRNGVPIGLSMVRLVANVLLGPVDRRIEEGLTPIYYGRYVDDIFLVIKNPGNLSNSGDVLRFIGERTRLLSRVNAKKKEVTLDLAEAMVGRTRLILQPAKQKTFFLTGQGGIDLLDNIESQIRSVSSERRLMPSPRNLERMTSAQVLTAAANAADEADTLRRADGLSVRRLGWSILLRSVETLSRDLRSADWIEQRNKFYQFAINHILRPDKILDHLDYLPRLLSLAVVLEDWTDAKRLLDAAESAVSVLEKCKSVTELRINGVNVREPAANLHHVWSELRQSILEASSEAIAKSLRWDRENGRIRRLSELALELCSRVGLGSSESQIGEIALRLREADLGKVAYKDHLRRHAARERPHAAREGELLGCYTHGQELLQFLVRSARSEGARPERRVRPKLAAVSPTSVDASLIPYLFPTRPYSAAEVALFLPEDCVFNSNPRNAAKSWATYVRAVRGIWVRPRLTADAEGTLRETGEGSQQKQSDMAVVGSDLRAIKVRLGISSLLTSDSSFALAANGTPDLSEERYLRIKTIVDQAITSKPQPTHLLLPELSIPDRWVATVAGLLSAEGISLIAGLDYKVAAGAKIHSDAVLVLTDDRLGFSSTIEVRQMKSCAAPGEEENLLKVFGRTWEPGLENAIKPIYSHYGFRFGVLVCSELQNINHRRRFQGEVDSMMVLAWNKDLETFSSLIESASLDVHAYIALVNNRQFGDGRVRSPAKAYHKRDICRVRGGENEHLVVAEIDIDELRAFQSRSRRWPAESDPFKPVPEGFKIAEGRRTLPK